MNEELNTAQCFTHLMVQIESLCRSDILSNELKVFFVKYNDPVYVKVEKLAIMIRLTNQNNIGQTLAELKECVVFSINRNKETPKMSFPHFVLFTASLLVYATSTRLSLNPGIVR